MARSHGRKRAFTLMELLVVISIIALLASILFPVFARARENARRSSCSSNLKQIGLGILQYSQDYDEKLPVHPVSTGTVAGNVLNYSTTSYNWIYEIQPYVKSWQLFRCPSMPNFAGGGGFNPSGNNASSYFVNGVVVNRALAVIPAPAEIIWCHESDFTYAAAIPRPVFDSDGGFGFKDKYITWMSSVYDNIHFSGANFLFCDGHVKWRAQSTVKAIEFGVDSTIVGATGTQAAFPQTWAL